MIEVGRMNRLQVRERTDHGLVLTDGEAGVLLPRKFVRPGTTLGDSLDVFVTTDSEDRLVATTQRPLGMVGELASMKVKAATDLGAFLDWGLDKDLLLPFREQRHPLRMGDRVVVRVLLDEKTRRPIASARLNRLLIAPVRVYEAGQKVPGIIIDVDRNGARVLLEEEALGRIFPDEIHERLQVGERREWVVKRVRPDGGIALALTAGGYAAAVDLGPAILDRLKSEGGFLPLSDASSPEEIRAAFGVSKSTYKKAIGGLLREGRITLEYHGIRLAPPR
jgi:predicted RNA-binding protein (virulence factor B family)